jgi:hypothetical protein
MTSVSGLPEAREGKDRRYGGPDLLRSATPPGDITVRRLDGSVEVVPYNHFGKRNGRNGYNGTGKPKAEGTTELTNHTFSSPSNCKVLSQGRRRTTDTVTTVLKLEDGYLVLCDEHVRRAPTQPTRQLAWQLAKDPRSFCSLCAGD